MYNYVNSPEIRAKLRPSKKIRELRYRIKYPYASILNGIRTKCKKSNIPCSINTAWARQTYTGRCALTNIPFQIVRNPFVVINPYHPSIDRINPNKGYTPGNCRWVLMAVNMLKFIGSDEDMFNIAKALLINNNIIL